MEDVLNILDGNVDRGNRDEAMVGNGTSIPNFRNTR